MFGSRKGWVVLGIVFLSVMLASSVFAQKPIQWKAQGFWGAGTTGHKTFEEFCARVKTLTNGRMEIKPFAVGAIVPYGELLTQIEKNVLQGMYTWPGWWSGKDPAFSALTDLIAGWNNPYDVLTLHYYEGGLKLLEKLYEPFGAYPVGIIPAPVESLVLKKPVYKLEDFKGLRIRSPEGMEGDWFKKMGAGVVVLPGGEVFSALDKGVVDGADWSSPALNMQSGLHKAAKYFFYPGWHSLPQNDFTVNKKEWDKLPKDIQEILRTAVREWAEELTQKSRLADIDAVEKMKKEGNVPIALSPDEFKRIRKVAEGIWDEWAQKSPMCKQSIEIQKNLMRKLGQL